MATRKYTQQARAAAAEETRDRILDAMRHHFSVAPVETLEHRTHCHDAGVARSTVYLVFGSKAGLFEALGRDLLERTGFKRIVEAVALPDAREAVRESLRAAASVYAAEREVNADDLFDVGARTRGGAGRLRSCRARAHRGAAPDGRAARPRGAPTRGGHGRGGDRHPVGHHEFETFDQLYTGRGLSVEDTAARLVVMAERALWAPSRVSRSAEAVRLTRDGCSGRGRPRAGGAAR